MLKRGIRYLLIVLSLSTGLRAQNYSLHLDTASACPGDTVSFGIWMENFNNIGAITLYVRYDSARLAYLGHSDVHAAFPGLISNGMIVPAIQVGISWSASMAGANAGSGKMMSLEFIHKAGSDSLWFGPNCEVADFSAAVLPVDYNSGLYQHNPPQITLQPSSDTIPVSAMSHMISCEAPGATGYQWYGIDTSGLLSELNDSTPLFSGTGTSDLTLHFQSPTFPQVLLGLRYVCRIEGCGEQWTDTAAPFFYSDVGLGQAAVQGKMACWPIPASEVIHVVLDQPYPDSHGRLVLCSLEGREVLSMNYEGPEVIIPCTHLAAGTYVLQYVPLSQDAVIMKSKIILTKP